MIGDNALAFERSQQFQPFGHFGIEPVVKTFEVALEHRGGFWIEGRESLSDVARDNFRILGVGQVMRIACGMDVAFGAVEPGGHFEQLDVFAASDVARGAGSQL